MLARWLTQNCSVLLLDEPTRGVDVGARGEIYTIVRDLAAKGLAVILVSSDMPELIGLSHRVLVMRSGGVAGELSRDGPRRTRRPGTHLPLCQRPGGCRMSATNREDAMSTTTDPVTALPPPDAAPETSKRFDRQWLTNFAIRNSMVIVLLLVIAYFSYRSARFATADNALTILVAAAPFALVALGQTFVILTGGIDLSVGSVIAVSAMTASAIVVGHPEQVWVTARRDRRRTAGRPDQRPGGQQSTLHPSSPRWARSRRARVSPM